jgi:hypothetical protein
MNTHESTRIVRPGLILAAGVLIVGCTPLKVSQTVGLQGLPPLADASQVTVVENLSDVRRPYQLVGKVTVYRSGTRITKAASQERICRHAAQMGADGVVGLHRNAGGGLYSGLAVKWLAPGEAKRPVSVPFVVAAMEVTPNASARGNQEKVADAIRSVLMYPLESKGYYLLPDPVTGVRGGIDGAVLLEDGALRTLVGPNAHLLLEIGSTGQADGTILIASASSIAVRARMLDKQSRRITYEGSGTGTAGGGFLVDAMAPNAKRIDAAVLGTLAALRDLRPIHQSTSL